MVTFTSINFISEEKEERPPFIDFTSAPPAFWGDRLFANCSFRVVSYTSVQKHNYLFPIADLTLNTKKRVQ